MSLAQHVASGKVPLEMFGRLAHKQQKHQIDLAELKERCQEIKWDVDQEVLVKFIESLYKNCDDLVKQWIYSDLLNNKYCKKKAETEELLDSSLLQRLDTNTKYDILQFIPTYSVVKSEQATIVGNEIVQLDSPFISMLKMRLINKFYNKIMLKKILTLKHLTLNVYSGPADVHRGTVMYFRAITAAQMKHKRNLERNRNYDLDSICLFDLSVTEQCETSNEPLGEEANTFATLLAGVNNSHFGVTQTAANPFDQSNPFVQIYSSNPFAQGNASIASASIFGGFEGYPEISNRSSTYDAFVKYDSFTSAPEDVLIGNLFSNKSQNDDHRQSTTESAVQYLSEDIDLYPRALIHCPSTTNSECKESPFYIPEIPINTTVESLTLVIGSMVGYPYIPSQLIEVCPNLKKLNLIYSQKFPIDFGFSFEFRSDSLEELHICFAQLGCLFPNHSGDLLPLFGTNTPKLRSITFSPIIPSQNISDNYLEILFDSLPITAIDKIHIYDKIGRNETQLIKTQYYETPNTLEKKREVNVYCVQHKSFLNSSIIEELVDMYGDLFVENVMPLMLFGFHLNNTQLENDSTQFRSYLIEEFRKYRDITYHLFRNKKIPIASIQKALLTSFLCNGKEKTIRTIKLQYLLYLCNQYQDSTLLNNKDNVLDISFVLFSIQNGWNFTKQSERLLEYFVSNQIDKGVSSMLKIFDFDEKFIESLIYQNTLLVRRSQHVTIELITHLYYRSPKYLFSMLARNYQIPNNDVPVTIPILAGLFNEVDSYLVCKLINEMDMETFNSIGQNNRGDNILHIFVCMELELNFNIFYCILKKNPNLINMVNHKLQTPLHYLMAGRNRKSPLLIQEIKQILKSSNSGLILEIDSPDYMEQTPIALFEAQEKANDYFIDKFTFK